MLKIETNSGNFKFGYNNLSGTFTQNSVQGLGMARKRSRTSYVINFDDITSSNIEWFGICISGLCEKWKPSDENNTVYVHIEIAETHELFSVISEILLSKDFRQSLPEKGYFILELNKNIL